PYSPYPFSPWDNYYVWYGDSHHGHGHHHHHHDGDHHGHGHDHDGDGYAHDGPRRRHGDPEPAAGDRPRFGSVANEAQRLAEREALERTRRVPETRLRQRRPGADGYPDRTALGHASPSPGRDARTMRTKPRETI